MTKQNKGYEPELPRNVQQEIDNHLAQQEELIVDKAVNEMNSERGLLSHHFNDRSIAPDSFQKEIAAVLLLSKEDVLGYKNLSIRLPIRDYANIKALSTVVSTPISSLARSLFLASLKEALIIYRHEASAEKLSEFDASFDAIYEGLLAEIEAEA
jgi:hypothetical protein